MTSWTERSWPTASGVIELGSATVSFSGSTGSASGRFDLCGRVLERVLEALDDFDRHGSDLAVLFTGRDRHLATLLRLCDRQLDAQDAVLVGRACLIGHDVGAELYLAPERALLDLDLLVHAAFRVVWLALTRDHQHPAADLEVHVVQPDAGEVGADHGFGRVAAVVDVDAGAEGAPVRG